MSIFTQSIGDRINTITERHIHILLPSQLPKDSPLSNQAQENTEQYQIPKEIVGPKQILPKAQRNLLPVFCKHGYDVGENSENLHITLMILCYVIIK